MTTFPEYNEIRDVAYTLSFIHYTLIKIVDNEKCMEKEEVKQLIMQATVNIGLALKIITKSEENG